MKNFVIHFVFFILAIGLVYLIIKPNNITDSRLSFKNNSHESLDSNVINNLNISKKNNSKSVWAHVLPNNNNNNNNNNNANLQINKIDKSLKYKNHNDIKNPFTKNNSGFSENSVSLDGINKFAAPDFTADQFKIKFKNVNLNEWLKKSAKFNPSIPGAAVPNDMEAYQIKGINGENIRYRQAMGFIENNNNDCVSVLLPI